MAVPRQKVNCSYGFKGVTNGSMLPVESLTLSKSVQLSSRLSKQPLIGREQPSEVIRMTPVDLIPTIKNADIDFVLVDAHGIGGWLPEARATEDVDFLVRIKDKQKATDALLKAFPNWQVEKFPDVWRFKQGEACLVDLMLTRAPLYKRVINEYREIRLGKLKVKVPKLEAALAMKFAAMTGHYRNFDKKYYDAGDFSGMVRKNKIIDFSLLRELGELVFVDGGAQIIKYVEDVCAGRRLEI